MVHTALCTRISNLKDYDTVVIDYDEGTCSLKEKCHAECGFSIDTHAKRTEETQ